MRAPRPSCRSAGGSSVCASISATRPASGAIRAGSQYSTAPRMPADAIGNPDQRGVPVVDVADLEVARHQPRRPASVGLPEPAVDRGQPEGLPRVISSGSPLDCAGRGPQPARGPTSARAASLSAPAAASWPRSPARRLAELVELPSVRQNLRDLLADVDHPRGAGAATDECGGRHPADQVGRDRTAASWGGGPGELPLAGRADAARSLDGRVRRWAR
jgi:hypothetical protein